MGPPHTPLHRCFSDGEGRGWGSLRLGELRAGGIVQVIAAFVEAQPGIPGFGDQLGFEQHTGIFLDFYPRPLLQGREKRVQNRVNAGAYASAFTLFSLPYFTP